MGQQVTTPQQITAFVQGLPQIVSESWCFECRICCRFPDTQDVQTPVWSSLEAEWAKESPDDWFKPDPEGSPSLHPRLTACSGGTHCPAFDQEANRCSIHPVKPLDCRLYPFVLAKSPSADQPVLAVDTKCPYVEAHGTDPEVLEYAQRLTGYLEQPVAAEYLKTNPQIVGRFWPEYVSIAPLTAQGIEKRPLPHPGGSPHPDLRPLLPEDYGLLQAAFAHRERRSSSYTLAGLIGWSDLIRLGWASFHGTFCLFAEQAGGFFMPLPPLGEENRIPAAAREAWGILSALNQGSGVSRIEGLEEQDRTLLADFLREGFVLQERQSEYLYRREDLVKLSGDRYRSQRGAVNRFKKRWPSHRMRPFEEADLAPCLQLFTRWAIRRQQEIPEVEGRRLVRDSLFFHRRLMMDCRLLGLQGWIVEIEGQIRAYTFGAPISSRSFCVLLEIADRSFPGLAQALFQEFCGRMEGFAWVNGMGDEGLAGLRQAKLGYRPAALISTGALLKKQA